MQANEQLEQLLGFTPFEFFDQLLDGAERQCILALSGFVKESGALAATAAKSAEIDRWRKHFEQNFRRNFDKFELYSRAMVFSLSLDEQRLLWRRERRPQAAAVTADTAVRLTGRHDDEDRTRLLTDEVAVDAELAALRQRLQAERRAIDELRSLDQRTGAYVQALAPYAQHPNRNWSLAATLRSFAALRSTLAELVDLEQDSRAQLRGTSFTEPLADEPPPVEQPSTPATVRNDDTSPLDTSCADASYRLTQTIQTILVEQSSVLENDWHNAPPYISQLFATFQQHKKIGSLTDLQGLLTQLVV